MRSPPMRPVRLPAVLAVAAAAVATGAGPSPAGAQEAWNGPRALELVAGAREVRQRTVQSDGLRSYAADARGYVYFFVDREGSDERNLVKTDQVALEVFWRAPDASRQRIVGLRDARSLPTNVQYHLDHLTVVQDDFADLIRLGDGDEVAAVAHPLAPASEQVYDFRLGDSLTLRLPAPADTVRVYEIQVRPVDPERPGIVGSVFVDRATRAVVRMRFTFTASSYVDPYLDFIRISLDNALWDGRFWLPHQQQVEIRRETPVLDFPFGSVIRGRYRITNYRINEPLSPLLFQGLRVTAAPEEERRAFPFEQGLHDELDAEGLGDIPDLEAIRAEAGQLVREQALSGLVPFRVYVPNVSSVARYNRAEGPFLGLGLGYRPAGLPRVRALGGYAFGRKRGQFRLTLDDGGGRPAREGAFFWHEPRDIGPVQAASGTGNSLNSLTEDRDFTDLYFTSGLRLRQGFRLSSAWALDVATRWEQQRTATDVVSDSSELAAGRFRPVLPAREGALLALDVEADWSGPSGLGAEAVLTLATFGGDPFNRFTGALTWTHQRLEGRRHSVVARIEGGAVSGGAPAQRHFLLGGRGSLPGYDFRSFVGDRYGFARVDGTLSLAWPWVTGRVFAAVGATSLRDHLPKDWVGSATDGARVSLGLGVDILWDVVRLEWGRGVSRDGGWEFNSFVTTRFWPVL